MELPKLTLCLLVKQEPDLEKFLENMAGFVDEIIAVINPDEPEITVKILEKHNSRIFRYEWKDDFSFSRNKSLEHATGDWILWIDPDCYINDDNKGKIKKFIFE